MDEIQTGALAPTQAEAPQTVEAVEIAAVEIEEDETGDVIVSTADGSAVATMTPEAFAQFCHHLAKLQPSANK